MDTVVGEALLGSTGHGPHMEFLYGERRVKSKIKHGSMIFDHFWGEGILYS